MAKHIRVVSDLHAEQFYGQDVQTLADLFVPADDRDQDAILVLAGDISSKGDQLLQLLDCWCSRFRQIVFVCGNHEWYRHDIVEHGKLIQEAGDALGICVSTNKVRCTEVDGVRFIYGTYWSDGGETAHDQLNVSHGLWDFKIISNGGSGFSVADMTKLHAKMRASVEAFLNVDSDLPTVVVTHHMPSYRLCHPRFGNKINGGFASNSDDLLIGDKAPDVWIHGHTHDTIDMKLYDTRIVCNPRGYVSEVNASVHNSFAPKFIEV